MQVLRKFIMNRSLYTGEDFKIIIRKKRRKIWDLINDNDLTNKRFGANFKKIIYMHDLHIYIRKMLTNREIVTVQKWDFFRFYFILLLKTCRFRSTKNAYLVYVLLYL